MCYTYTIYYTCGCHYAQSSQDEVCGGYCSGPDIKYNEDMDRELNKRCEKHPNEGDKEGDGDDVWEDEDEEEEDDDNDDNQVGEEEEANKSKTNGVQVNGHSK